MVLNEKVLFLGKRFSEILVTFEQLIRYICVGLIASAADIFFLHFFTESFLIWYVLSAGLSYLIGVVIVFLLNKYWSFQKFFHTKVQILRYVILVAVNYLVVMFFIYILREYFTVPYMLAKLAIICLQVTWNFFIYKFWVFAK